MTTSEEYPLPLTCQDRAHRALLEVWWTGNILRRAARRLFGSLETSEAQFNIMLVLRDVPGPMTQGGLARLLLVDEANVTGLVDRLEGQHLIKRRSVPGDRRSHHVALTSLGRKKVDTLDAAYRAKIQQIMSALSSSQQQELTRLMGRLRTGLARSMAAVLENRHPQQDSKGRRR